MSFLIKRGIVKESKLRGWLYVIIILVLVDCSLVKFDFPVNLLIPSILFFSLISLMKLEYAIYALIISGIFSRIMGVDLVGLPPLYLSQFLLGIIVIILFFNWFIKRENFLFSQSPINKPVFFILAWSLISCIGANYIGTASTGALKHQINSLILIFLTASYFYIIASVIHDRNAVINFIKILVIISFVCIILLYIAFFSQENIGIGLSTRVFSFHGIRTTAPLGIMFFLLIGFLFEINNLRYKGLILMGLLMCISCLLINFFRSSFVTTPACFLFLLLFTKKKKMFLICFSIIIIVLIYSVDLPSQLRNIREAYFSAKELLTSGSTTVLPGVTWSRIYTMMDALRIVKDNPIFGIGLDSYQHHTKLLFFYKEGGIFLPMSSAHNTFLQIAANSGIISIIFLLWLMVAIWKESTSIYVRLEDPFYKSIVLGFIGMFVGTVIRTSIDESFLIYGSTYFRDLGDQGYFWMYLGLVKAIGNITSKESTEA